MNNEEETYIEGELRATTIGGAKMKVWPPLPTNPRWFNAITALRKSKRSFMVTISGKREKGSKLTAGTTRL